ncbi:hypothetical protein [Bacillus massiliigorillae]|uniref:hypothetical protein n=1 Tax=Bacillus massiliigorillae TaxID=1243664 RepID=UPI0003A576B7|nr:hypothetical protein [Bacillus massiliigorillae]
MNNLERLKLEVQGITLTDEELTIYIQENNLEPSIIYNPQSKEDKLSIYNTALSILESIANNPQLMKTIKYKDTTLDSFHDTLMARIDQLERKVREMKTNFDREDVSSNTFMLFNS